ncbi:transcript variant X10 [Nothobranchius furzeri]|uniref:Transcript variant X10 n=1 Tax=Nothobranchius furzeri TaxID=105023 RepID=A0A9D2XSA7_NOTFU|nr:transcript variant X10 [Nothobranchius furzeri]
MASIPVLLLLLGGTFLLSGTPAQRIRARHHNMKVRINATGDTIVMKFVRPSPDVKLEGYILGYGSSVFSKQLIPLPENGKPYETEMDAEPKYLVAVQPIPANDVKKHCTGKVNLEKPLHLVIGSISPTSVLLSWGNHLKTPYEGNVMNECLEEGYYTIRFRERNRKWIYQTCPTSDTVIDNLKPNTPYEFGVRSNKDNRSGMWSKPVVHNTNTGNKNGQQPYKQRHPPPKLMKPLKNIPVRPALHNNTRPHPPSLIKYPGFSGLPRSSFGAVPRPAVHAKPNFVRKLGETDKVNLVEKSEKSDFLPQKVPPATAKPTKLERTKTTTVPPTAAATKQETWEESDLFKSQPASDIDALGNKRYVAPHVVYQTGKKPDEPCSITSSLTYFPESEPGETNVTSRPKNPPSNLTVVTVEGCPSFIILDWEKTDNHTTEYEVISTAKGPDGEQVSVLTTNQTHTAVENLKPESSYEFKVKPKNELGEGPPSEPVSFSTESADPRVSENVSGKDAIWTQFPFKTDSYSDCHGKQYVKRTWYRKFVGVQLCNSLRYKIYLSDSLTGKFYNIGDQSGFGEDHCQFVDSFLDGRTGRQLRSYQLPSRTGFYRALRQEPVHFGQMGGHSHINYVSWYECGIPIPGKW